MREHEQHARHAPQHANVVLGFPFVAEFSVNPDDWRSPTSSAHIQRVSEELGRFHLGPLEPTHASIRSRPFQPLSKGAIVTPTRCLHRGRSIPGIGWPTHITEPSCSGQKTRPSLQPICPLSPAVLVSCLAPRGCGGMADAHGSGPCGGNPVKVQLLSPAPSD